MSKQAGIVIALLAAFSATTADHAAAAPLRPQVGTPKPSPRAKRAQTKRRKARQAEADKSSPSSKGGSGSKPAPKPKPKRKIGAVELKRASRLIDAMASARRRTRDESWSGEATLIDRLGTRRTMDVRVEQAWKDGACRALVVHGRPGDLPDVGHLFVIDAKGKNRGWSFRPEDKRVVERASVDERLGRSALAFADLIGYDVARHRLAYREGSVHHGKRAMRFSGTPLSKRAYARAVFDVRNDYKLAGRVRLYRDDEKPWRELRFSDVDHVGVHRRWSSIVVLDHERSASALVKIGERRVNRGLDFDSLTAERLPAVLAGR